MAEKRDQTFELLAPDDRGPARREALGKLRIPELLGRRLRDLPALSVLIKDRDDLTILA